MRRVAWIVVACAGCLSAPGGSGGGGDGDGGAVGGDGGAAVGELVSQLDLGAATVRAARSRSSGDVFLTGAFSDDSPLGDGLSSQGGLDLYLAALDGKGGLRYATSYGGLGDESPGAIAVDPSTDEIVVTGLYVGEATAGSATFPVPEGDTPYLFVAGYDAEGAYRWSHPATGPGLIQPSSNLSIAGDGKVLAAGFFDGHLEIGGDSTDALGGHDIFYVAVTAGGEVQPIVHHGTSGTESCTDAVIGSAGPVYLIGNMIEGFSLGGEVIEGDGATIEGFIAAVNEAGDSAEWSVVLSGAGDFGSALGASRPDGGLILFGWFTGELVIPTAESFAADEADLLVVSVDPDGSVAWARQLGGPGTDYPVSVSVLGDGRVLLGGTFQESATFGDQDLAGHGELDGFAAILSPAGEVEWARALGGALDDAVVAVVEGDDGTIFAGLLYRGVLDLGLGPIGEADGVAHAALLRLRP